MIKHISINGTSREALVEARTDVLNFLRQAQGALNGCRPHKRDYVGDDEGYEIDCATHDDRGCHLMEIIGFIECEADAINNLP